ncbi:MAG: hypothetical protein ACFE9Q_14185 [Candidatus Hodarchaeota archaeon]
MSEKIINFCPYCGKRLPKYSKITTNFCCFCGRNLKNKKERLTHEVQCTICHKIVDLNRHKTIKCSFCESVYHSSCVSSWLLKYNACPMCQNVFIIPNMTIPLRKY